MTESQIRRAKQLAKAVNGCDKELQGLLLEAVEELEQAYGSWSPWRPHLNVQLNDDDE